MLDIFKNFSSNTLSANGNQTFITDAVPEGIGEGLVFIKVFRSGSFNYRFVYSGVIDSTFADGSVSSCNMLCSWSIESLSVAVTDDCNFENLNFSPVHFKGKEGTVVNGEQYVVSDSVRISAYKGDYLCLKISFSGTRIPCHKESIIPIYRRFTDGYRLCPEVPVPVFTGIDYEPAKRVAFLGDSITQGIGSTFNSYKNFAAVAAETIGEMYSFWNLGLGFGRASDAASNGIWIEKAKMNDVVVLCYGVNDIFKEFNAEKLKSDLFKIVSLLKENGVKVLLQSIPPFDYDEFYAEIWHEVNRYLRTELSLITDGFLGCVPVLSLNGGDSPVSRYGGHPNDEGCARWAEALIPEINKLL